MLKNTTKKKIAKLFKPIYRLYSGYKLRQYMKQDPKDVADIRYNKIFGRSINWSNPTEFNEKIRWIQFNTDTSKWTLLADKYRCRDFVKEKGYSQILIPLLGVWEKVEDVNFEQLPDSFVIKTNHGSGDVIVVENKDCIDLGIIRKKMDYYLKTPYGYKTAEPHYLGIKPLVIAEQVLINDTSWSSSIVDYKFYCFNGEPFCCGVFFNRDVKSHTKVAEIYDMNWVRHDEWVKEEKKPTQIVDVPRPQNLNQMIQACKDLASEFPFVRMDFYEVGGNFKFGEFTFTPSCCSGGSLSDLLNMKMGEILKIK